METVAEVYSLTSKNCIETATVAGVYSLTSGNCFVEKSYNLDLQGAVTPDRWGMDRRGDTVVYCMGTSRKHFG